MVKPFAQPGELGQDVEVAVACTSIAQRQVFGGP
jgi:hypothetical protein